MRQIKATRNAKLYFGPPIRIDTTAQMTQGILYFIVGVMPPLILAAVAVIPVIRSRQVPYIFALFVFVVGTAWWIALILPSLSSTTMSRPLAGRAALCGATFGAAMAVWALVLEWCRTRRVR